jgi:type I restriction enzyme M protein
VYDIFGTFSSFLKIPNEFYISTAIAEEEIDLSAVNRELLTLENKIVAATEKHNEFLKELGLPPLP